jgi:hypothetical protein
MAASGCTCIDIQPGTKRAEAAQFQLVCINKTVVSIRDSYSAWCLVDTIELGAMEPKLLISPRERGLIRIAGEHVTYVRLLVMLNHS